MNIYHSTGDYTDGQAQGAAKGVEKDVRAAGGIVYVSRSFSHGSAVIVLSLPVEADPAVVAPEIAWKEYVDGQAE